MTCGIYKITGPNNTIYIGESSNIEKRWIEHKQAQEIAYKLLGINDRPNFEIIVKLPSNINKKERIRIERWWIEKFKETKIVVNIDEIERGKKISLKMKGHKVCLKTKEKLSKAHKNRWLGKNSPTYKGEKIRLKNIKTGEIIEGEGITNISNITGIHRSHLRKLLNGQCLLAKGYQIKEYNDKQRNNI